MKWIVIIVIRIYQRLISPLLADHCRFYPTCSDYLCQSLEKWGLAKGLCKGLIRIIKCNPFHSGGYDPVK